MDRQDEALKILKDIRHIYRLIEQLQEDIDRIYTSLTNTTVKPKEIDIQTSLPADPMADKVALMVEYEKKLEAYQLDLIERKNLVIDTIKTMDVDNQQYIILKYMNNKTIDQIASIVGYGSRQTWENIHKAEQQFIEIYSNN